MVWDARLDSGEPSIATCLPFVGLCQRAVTGPANPLTSIVIWRSLVPRRGQVGESQLPIGCRRRDRDTVAFTAAGSNDCVFLVGPECVPGSADENVSPSNHVPRSALVKHFCQVVFGLKIPGPSKCQIGELPTNPPHAPERMALYA